MPAPEWGHSGTEWLPTAKQRRAEAVNTKIKGQSTPLKAKKEGGYLQTKNIIIVVTCLRSLFVIVFCKIHDIHYMNSFMEELESFIYIYKKKTAVGLQTGGLEMLTIHDFPYT